MPILVNRDYALPACVDRHWLVIAVSYSGNTEETLSAYAQARRRGCRMVAITSGGTLAARAARDHVPILRLPAGYPPRATVGYLFFTPLAYLRSLGLIRVSDGEIAEAIRMIRVRVRAGLAPARRVAKSLAGRIPMIYAPESLLPVAARWKNQMEENAKVWCSALAIPEANHNDIESWGRGPAWARSQVVLLRDPRGESPALRRRLDISTRMLRAASRGRLITVRAEGRGALARMWSLVALGDAVSVALADRLRVNSMPIPMIDRLKRALSTGVGAAPRAARPCRSAGVEAAPSHQA